jgi:threonine 3-dehydrogenase
MLRAMHHGGGMALLGIPPTETSPSTGTRSSSRGSTIKGIYGREMFETWYKMASMLQSGLDVSPIITHRFKAEDYLEGFRTMGSGQSGKVILDWA